MSALWRRFLIAWHFLTAVPLTRHGEVTAAEFAGSMIWFPVVGLVLGVILVAAALFLSTIFAPMVVDALLVVLLVLATGGLHQDGLADTIDGWVGGRTAEERLQIMRDGCIGAIGATGLILGLGLRYAGLAALPVSERVPVLLALPVVGRWSMVVGAIGTVYARREGGLAQPFLEQVSFRILALTTLLPAAVLGVVVGPLPALIALLAAAGVSRLVVALGQRLCGGITGDMLGAVNELAEILFLLIAPVLVRVR